MRILGNGIVDDDFENGLTEPETKPLNNGCIVLL
jgi:hypothetical protein